MSRDFFNLFELFLQWEGKSEDFLKHVKNSEELDLSHFETSIISNKLVLSLEYSKEN